MEPSIGVLNVGAGDIKLTFDPSNPGEVIRSSRIVKDMLRRGYAMIIEVDDGKGGKMPARVKEFDPMVAEYIIADLDPVEAARVDAEDAENQEVEAAAPGAAGKPTAEPRGKRTGKRGAATKRIPAAGTKGVAIARTAGG